MRTRIAAAALALTAFASVPPVQAVELAGVEVEDRLDADGTELLLNGAGLRSRFMIKLYVAGLYTAQGGGSAETIVADDAPMAITLDIVSDRVTRDKMIEALDDGFAASTGGDTAALADGMAQLQETMGGELAAGSSMMFAYAPQGGTTVWRDGEPVGVIEGLAFKQALFGIWLSEKPVARKLKAGMLGG